MNERIRELALQAGDDSDFEIDLVVDDFLERFAELIVHECAIAMSKIPGGYSAEQYYKSNKTIKEHFGVE